MNFLTPVIGTPLATAKSLRYGACTVLLTAKGFVVGDPAAFDMPELIEEAFALHPGSGFINGRLHLHSRRFPMVYPGSVPRLLILSRQLTVISVADVTPGMRGPLQKELQALPDFKNPDPEVLRNVMPGFEVFEETIMASS